MDKVVINNSEGGNSMVSGASFAAMITTLLLSMVLPVAILIVFALVRRKKGVVPAWLLGAAGFFVMQVILRLPIISMLSAIPGFAVFVENFYIVYIFVLALTAALFEVVARFGVAKILQKNMNPEKGLAAGLGHGGIEAIFLIGMTYVSNLLIAVMINTGTFTEIMAAMAGTGADSSAKADTMDRHRARDRMKVISFFIFFSSFFSFRQPFTAPTTIFSSSFRIKKGSSSRTGKVAMMMATY